MAADLALPRPFPIAWPPASTYIPRHRTTHIAYTGSGTSSCSGQLQAMNHLMIIAGLVATLTLVPCLTATAQTFREQVETDWLLQEQERRLAVRWRPDDPAMWQDQIRAMLQACRQVAAERQSQGIQLQTLLQAAETASSAASDSSAHELRRAYLDVRWALRHLLLSDPLLDFDQLLFTTRVPGVYNHMSDQYYGWWSRPGGGLHLLRGYRTDTPQLQSISHTFTEPGSFLRPAISYDGHKVLFAWARHVSRSHR
jgi:hypothetical protein